MLEWATSSGFGFILALVALVMSLHTIRLVLFTLPNRWLRSRNILARGWPPPHCDADGDAVRNEDDDER